MNTLAHAGPGPWILFFPLVWAAVVIAVVTVARRAGWRRGRGFGPGFGPGARRDGGPDEHSPIALLGHRFAAGEIDEDEYWRRLSVLEEQFGRAADPKGRRT
ncbi:SHOCT domain-containing protein [Streptomyces sp. SP18ES09]|uniref:SHOCT domain-containing protein n=1 Tax=Streptomyces sp. SP18ES09 TaxID=3002532 RepID=UPI002E7950B7|nr:SHOCT domain-containing protein [Streptomyces sp. SP18ES09]MEE1813850.1 SHOCT domain-containing protein [Streptomyces sp. SP18ES09]